METQPTKMTKRQSYVLSLIIRHQRVEGYPPSIRWLSKQLKIQPTGVTHHLDALAKKRWIRRDKGVARGIVVLEQKEGETGI